MQPLSCNLSCCFLGYFGGMGVYFSVTGSFLISINIDLGTFGASTFMSAGASRTETRFSFCIRLFSPGGRRTRLSRVPSQIPTLGVLRPRVMTPYCKSCSTCLALPLVTPRPQPPFPHNLFLLLTKPKPPSLPSHNPLFEQNLASH